MDAARRQPLVVASAMALFVVLAPGCRSSEEDAVSPIVDTGGNPACVTYDGPPSNGELPIDGTGASERVPVCAPRCGVATAFDGFPYVEALPTGSCTAATTCDIAAVPHCGCSEDRGPVNSYRCTCTSGRWSCRILVQGGAICRASCPRDADASEVDVSEVDARDADASDATVDAAPLTSCATDRLPTPGTACTMPNGTYCRLKSCTLGCEDECACRDGVWRCTPSCRDWYGCGSAPSCTDVCPDAGAPG